MAGWRQMIAGGVGVTAALGVFVGATPASLSVAAAQVAGESSAAKKKSPMRMGPRRGPPPNRDLVEPDRPVEKVEVDVATRSVAVTTAFTGHEILVFGAIDNSQQPGEEGNYYDVVVVVEGTPAPIVVRRKGEVAGVWVNTASMVFSAVPNYYAVASNRPIEEIAGPHVLERHAIGFAHINMTPAPGYRWTQREYELAAFKAAVIRVKQDQGLYLVKARDGVSFIGRSLFRSTIALPANVPVGPLIARTYLFRDGQVLSTHIARVTLEHAGIERVLHSFAFRHPFTYGVFAVILAVVSGLLASAYFRRAPA